MIYDQKSLPCHTELQSRFETAKPTTFTLCVEYREVLTVSRFVLQTGDRLFAFQIFTDTRAGVSLDSLVPCANNQHPGPLKRRCHELFFTRPRTQRR